MRPLPAHRIAAARAAAQVLFAGLCGVAIAACGGVSGGRVDPGYPTAYPHVVRATTLLARLDGDIIRLAAPIGWGLAHLGVDRATPRAFVRLDGACYLSVTITGSSPRTLTPKAVAALYTTPAGGYTWTITHRGGDILALLGEENATTGKLSRSSLGTVYLPTGTHTYLAVDYGAGVWPFDGHACPAAAVATRLPTLTAAIESILYSARIVPPGHPADDALTAAPLTVSAPTSAQALVSERTRVPTAT